MNQSSHNSNGNSHAVDEWSIYFDVIHEARARGIEFAIGGGFAVAAYTKHRQTTKDIDLYVLPQERERMIEVVRHCGLQDYYDVLPYDRNWIFRSHRDGIIVDVMWSMPNQRGQVDWQWLTRGPEVELQSEMLRVLPVEELIWAKLYVLQRDRCDWPDIINLIEASSETLDWDHLLERLGDDTPLLAAVLTVYGWLMPDQLLKLPVLVEILARPSHRHPDATPREDLLDSRPWFAAALKLSPQEK